MQKRKEKSKTCTKALKMKRSDTILEELEKIQETFVENIFTHSDFGTHVKEENKSNLIIEKLYIID